MKVNVSKKWGVFLLLTILLTGVLVFEAGAAYAVNAELNPNMTIFVDGVERDFYNVSGQEVHPILYNGTTYLPVRAIGELMGKNVDWNESTRTVTLGGARTTPAVTGTPDTQAVISEVAVQIRDDFTIVVDGVVRTFNDANGARVYPMLYNGSVYLPIRAIGELMGKTVTWDGASSTIWLTGSGLVTDADSFSPGNVTDPAQTTTPSGQTENNGLISVETAKQKALDHAGLNAADVTFIKARLDWDDGRRVYEVEFYTADYKEYDYEIDAVTGAVRSFDFDAEFYTPPANNTGSYIGMERAKEIALGKVPGATGANIVKCKFDFDDRRAEYEVEIVYNSMEYDFEIDATTGDILSWDSESIFD